MDRGVKLIEADLLEEQDYFIDGLRAWPVRLLFADGTVRRSEIRLPPEIVAEPHLTDVMRPLFALADRSDCGGCGG